ncbi:MAG: hypothetical protein PHW64_01205 [Sulfuricurvum sp.]|nr:hypothetical protein [Sulfuricurvum sp.]
MEAIAGAGAASTVVSPMSLMVVQAVKSGKTLAQAKADVAQQTGVAEADLLKDPIAESTKSAAGAKLLLESVKMAKAIEILVAKGQSYAQASASVATAVQANNLSTLAPEIGTLVTAIDAQKTATTTALASADAAKVVEQAVTVAASMIVANPSAQVSIANLQTIVTNVNTNTTAGKVVDYSALGTAIQSIDTTNAANNTNATNTGSTAIVDKTTYETAQNTAANTAAGTTNAPSVTVSDMTLTLGSSATVNGNNFSTTMAAGTPTDVVLGFTATGANGFAVTNGVLKAKIALDANNYLVISVDGVTVTTGTDGALTMTIASGANVTVDSNGVQSVNSAAGKLDSALTLNTMSLSMNALLNKISTNATAINASRTQILNRLAVKATYTVTVGVYGINSVTTSNLFDQSAILGTGFKGYTGTVVLN